MTNDMKELIERRREGFTGLADQMRDVADALEADLCAVVKPLVWKYYRDPKEASEARTQIGNWAIWEINGVAYCYGPDDICGKLCGDSIDDAKAAAQADYESRILSALNIRSASDVAAEARAGVIEAAKKRLFTSACFHSDIGDPSKSSVFLEARSDINHLHDTDTLAAIERIKEQARKEERERCANIAENQWRHWSGNSSGVSCDASACENIAKAIKEGE